MDTLAVPVGAAVQEVAGTGVGTAQVVAAADTGAGEDTVEEAEAGTWAAEDTVYTLAVPCTAAVGSMLALVSFSAVRKQAQEHQLKLFRRKRRYLQGTVYGFCHL